MVSNIETNIKAERDPIMSLVLQLPTNAPRDVLVSQGLEKGVGCVSLSKNASEDSGVVIGKVMSTQIPTSILMNPINSFST